MNPLLIITALVVLLAGCQLTVSVGGPEVMVRHTHEAPASPPAKAEPAVVTTEQAKDAPEVAKDAPAPLAAETETVAACPAVPAPVECAAPGPAVMTTAGEQPSSTAVSTVDAQPQEAPSEEKKSDEQAQQAEPETPGVIAEEKSTVTQETFDVEKYVNQSSSCVQQTPCSQVKAEDKITPPPLAAEETKPSAPPKPAPAANAAAGNDKKANATETGILRVERRRPTPSMRDVPAGIPR